MEKLFAEGNLIKSAGVPKDINASAFAGERISMAKGYRMAIVVEFDAGSEDVAVTFQQHDAASAGNSKAFTNVNPVFEKLDAAVSFTSQSAFTAADANAVKGIVVFEILAEELDRANDYAFISADIAAGSAAKVCSVMYIGHKPVREPAHKVEL